MIVDRVKFELVNRGLSTSIVGDVCLRKAGSLVRGSARDAVVE
jgi:hypothetical protein